MRHPLFYQKTNLYQYAVGFVAIAAIQLVLLNKVCHLAMEEAVTDAVISNLIFALLGVCCWYVIRFISMDHGSVAMVWFNQWISAILFLVIWQLASYFLLIHIISGESYLHFLNHSIPLRLIFGLFLYGVIALSYYLYKYYYSFKERLKREADWNTLVKEGELALLKSQLQPHFIFNTLNSIQALLLADPEKAQIMVVKLASFLRLSMTKHEDKLISLKEEIENSTLYTDIEKIRFAERLVVDIQAEEGTLSFVVPHLILQPLLENAIRHGLHQFLETVTVQVKAVIEEKAIRLSVSNNHDAQEKKQSGAGLGLKHVRKRMALLYGRKDLVQVKDENGIFKIELLFPQY